MAISSCAVIDCDIFSQLRRAILHSFKTVTTMVDGNRVMNFTRNKRDMDAGSRVDRVQIETGFKDALRPKRALSLC